MKTPTIKEVMDSPVYSFWLKDALHTALMRDPVDVLNDAALLVKILKDRYERIVLDQEGY